MTAPGAALYRSLVRLYPRPFRDRYGDDLVQHFADLVRDRGHAAAWARTAVDLIVTVPRYRLEAVMSEDRSATALTAAVAGLAAAGLFMVVLMGLAAGLLAVFAAVVLGVAQRGRLARAIRTTVPNRRLRRFRVAAVLTVVGLATVVSYAEAVRDEHVSGLSLIVHNAIGVPALIGAIAFALAALATPRTGGPPPLFAGGLTAIAAAVAVPMVDGGEVSESWWVVMAVLFVVGLGLVVGGLVTSLGTRGARRVAS